MKHALLILLVVLSFSSGCGGDDPGSINATDKIQLLKIRIGSETILNTTTLVTEIDKPIVATFSASLDPATVDANIQLLDEDEFEINLDFSLLDDNKTVSALPASELKENSTYTFVIKNGLIGKSKETFDGFQQPFKTANAPLEILSAKIDDVEVGANNGQISGIGFLPQIKLSFSSPISPEDIIGKSTLVGKTSVPLTISQVNDSTLLFVPTEELSGYRRNRLTLSSSIAVDEKAFDGYSLSFFTKLDSTLKFPEITDDELLTKVQEQTFKYFWDFAHPVSGLARERNASGNTVTIGGSGFGVMAIIVGIERGFISRAEGVDRLEKIINFLLNDADRFHGVWSHWLNGNTGDVIPFSADDDGGDLVETAFMVQALLTVRQYLEESDTQESAIISNITTLWNEVEWNWYLQEGDDYLTWHWSPNFGFQKNHSILGWNESLIVYVLAASSPTYTIDKSVYTDGWARSGGMSNGNSYYDITLPLGETRGGPLFFSHYSFLGLDPRNLVDTYANYWEQNVAHSLINRAYCISNPKNFIGYSQYCWGLTASDNPSGYSAHSPTNDLGVITPTAAISSISYTPEESMDAIRHFYYILGDRLWGEYGFYDAFDISENWVASSYLAIDQGPIICMIENHRSGLLWDLFMSAPEVQTGLDKLGFTY
jgi:hypothetical protein